MTKIDVYKKYLDDLPEFGRLRYVVSESFWYRVWRNDFSKLKCPKICKFSECKICSTAKLHKQVAPAEMKGGLKVIDPFLFDCIDFFLKTNVDLANPLITNCLVPSIMQCVSRSFYRRTELMRELNERSTISTCAKPAPPKATQTGGSTLP